MKNSTFKNLGILASATFIIVSCYNTFLMNSNQFMNDKDVRFVKRLDEMNGKVLVATAQNFETLKEESIQAPIFKKKAFVAQASSQSSQEVVEQRTASIVEDLALNASQVFNKRFPAALMASEGKISGSLTSKDGVIESIEVSLPNNEMISISTNSEMEGNVFQYEDGETKEVYSGMFYKINEGSYMVTLTNDKRFAGTRIQFDNASIEETSAPAQDESINWATQEDNQENRTIANDNQNSQDAYNDNVQAQEEGISNQENAQVDQNAQEQALENNEQAQVDNNEAPAQEAYGFNFNA